MVNYNTNFLCKKKKKNQPLYLANKYFKYNNIASSSTPYTEKKAYVDYKRNANRVSRLTNLKSLNFTK